MSGTLRRVARVSTYPGSRAAWRESRYLALLRAADRVGIPWDAALEVARVLVILAAQETGDGRGESNFNFGSIHAGSASGIDEHEGWDGAYYDATDSATLGGPRHPVRFRAYPDVDQAATDMLQLFMGSGYRASWAELVEALWRTPRPEEAITRRWYDAMTRAGYHPWRQESTDEFVRLWGRTAPPA